MDNRSGQDFEEHRAVLFTLAYSMLGSAAEAEDIVREPWLRRQLPPVAALIYMLCFTSFSTILILGGGPKATTVELAIYQALTFTYEPDRATDLSFDFLKTIHLETLPEKPERWVVYADRTLLSDEQMQRLNIVFKRIPRDISKL